MKNFRVTNKLLLICLILLFLIVIKVNAQTNCTITDQGGLLTKPTYKCAPYEIRWKIIYVGLDPDELNVVEVNWGDGTIETFELQNSVDDEFDVTRRHTYQVGPKPCNYIATARLFVNGEFCESSVQTHLIDVWDTDDVLGPQKLRVDVEEHLVCAGNQVNITFRDLTIFDCIPTNDPQNLGRWIQWVYDTDPFTNPITGVTIDGAVRSPGFSEPPVYFPKEALSSNVITLPINVPKTSIAGQYMELTLNNWNSCNPYDTDGNPSNDPENPPVTKTVYIRIIDAPHADFVINPNPVCIGNVVTYTNNSTGGLQYEWFFHDGTTSSAYSPPNKTYNMLGTFQDSLIVTDNQITGNTGTCFTKAIRDIEIIPQPIASFTIDPPGEQCSDVPIALTNTSQHVPVGTLWFWEIRKSAPDGQQVDLNGADIAGYASNDKDPVANLPYFGTDLIANYYVRLVLETPNDCHDISDWQIISRKVDVGIPAFIAPVVDRCQGAATTQYNATAAHATGYLWEILPAEAGTIDADGLVTWDAAFSGTAKIIVTAIGCGPDKSNEIDVNVTPVVGVPDAIAGTTERCQGSGSDTYSSSATNATSYTWSISGAGNTISGNTENATVTWHPNFSGNATITVVAIGCNGPSTPVTLNVNVKPIPQLSNIDYNLTICSGEEAVFMPSSALAGSLFRWTTTISPFISGVIPPSATDMVIGTDRISDFLNNSNSIDEIVVYHITPYKDGCEGTTRDFVVTVNPRKPDDAGAIAGPALFCEKESGLVYSVPAIVNAAEYVWGLPAGAVITSGANTNTITVDFASAAPGNHVISVFGRNGCGVGASATYPIEIKPLPILVITDPAMVCEPGTVDITAGAVTAGSDDGVLNYWTDAAATVPLVNPSTLSASGIYYIKLTSAINCDVIAPVLVNVNPIPDVDINAAATALCNGGQTYIELSSTLAGTAFSWTVVQSHPLGASNGSGSLIQQTLNNDSDVPQTVTYTVTPRANGCDGPSRDIIITVQPTPVATATVASNVMCNHNETDIDLSSNVAGTTFTWTVNVEPGLEGTSNGTGSAIKQSLTNTTFVNRSVTYTITPSANGCDGPSINVVITVRPTPDLTATIANSQICTGSQSNIGLSSNVAGTIFSWTVSHSDPSVSGASAGSGTTIQHTLTNTSSTNQTVTYHITTEANGCAGESEDVVITVNPLPDDAGVIAGTDIMCEKASGVLYQVPAIANATNYIWTLPAGATITAGTNTRTITVDFTGTAPGNYSIGVYGQNTCGNGGSSTIDIEIKPTPVLTAIAVNPVICSNSDAVISLSSNLGGTLYSWSVIDKGPNISGESNASNQNVAEIRQLLTNSSTVPQTITYRIRPVLNGCEGTPVDVAITVNPAPQVVINAAATSICNGGQASITLSSPTPGATFSWTMVSDPSITGASAGNGNLIQQTLTNSSSTPQTVTYNVTPTANGCSGTIGSIVITVQPTPDVVATVENSILCDNSETNISLSGNVAGTTFSWTVNADAGIQGASSGNGNTIQQNLTNTTNVNQTVTYTITPSANGCNGPSTNVVIIVRPKPTLITNVSSPQICSGAQASIGLSSNVAGTVFSWTVTHSDPSVSGGSSGTGSSILQTLANSGNAIQTVTYHITTEANGCAGESRAVIITVYPIPVLTLNTVNSTICNGDYAQVNFSSTVAGTTYSWTVDVSNPALLTGASAGSGSSISQALNNAGISNEQATFRVTPRANGCNGEFEETTITVIPVVTAADAGPNNATCEREFVLSANTPQVGTGKWAKVFGVGTATFNDDTDPNTLVSVSAAGTYVFSWTISNAPCGTSIDYVEIVFKDPPSTPNISGNTQVCVNTENVLYQVAFRSGSTFAWSIEPAMNAPAVKFGGGINDFLISLDFGSIPWSGELIVTETNNGCPGEEKRLAITSYPLPVANAGPDQTICQGSSVILGGLPSATGGSGTYTYVWFPSTDLDNAFAANPIATLNIGRTYTLRVTDASTGCVSLEDNVTIAIENELTAGSIGSNQTICEGSVPAPFSQIAASGGDGVYSYQWQKATDEGGPWEDITGAASASYVETQPLSTTTYYRRKVTGGLCGEKFSNFIRITVQPPLQAGSIAADQTIIINSTPALLTNEESAQAGPGVTILYQWQQATIPNVFSSIPGATGPTYQPGTLSTTTYFRRRASGGACSSVFSNIVTITVEEPSTPGAIAENQTICTNTIPAEIVEIEPATGVPGTEQYRWVYSANGMDFTVIPGATGTNFMPTEPLTQTSYYRRDFRSGAAGTWVESNVVTITVQSYLDGGEVGSDQIICQGGDPVAFTSVQSPQGGAGLGNYQYQWMSSTSDSGPFSNIAGANASTYDVPAGLANTTWYVRRVSGGACPPALSNSIRVLVEPSLTGGSVQSSQTVCYGTQPTEFTNSTYPLGGNGAYTYQWQFRIGTSPFIDIDGANGESYLVPDGMEITTTYRRKVNAGVCPQAFSNEVVVTVHQPLYPGSIAGEQTVCKFADPGIIMSIASPFGGAGPSTYQYQWKSSYDGVTFTNIDGATSSSYDPPAGISQTTYYIREVRSGSCGPELSNVVAVYVQEQLDAGSITGESTICQGFAPGIISNQTTASGGDGSYYYQWQWSHAMGGPYADIPSAQDIDFQPGVLNNTTYYVRKVTAGVCPPRITNEVRVIVNPTINPGSIGGEQVICYGSLPTAFGQTPATGGNGSPEYQWESAHDLAGPFTAIPGATSATYVVTEPMHVTTFFRRKASAGICEPRYTNVIKVTVDEPVNPGSVGTDQTIPIGMVPTLLEEIDAPGGGNGTTFNYQWQASQSISGPYSEIYGATQKDFQPGALFMTTYFRRMVTSGQCQPQYSEPVKITVEEISEGGYVVIGSNQHICAGQVPGSFEEHTGASGGDGTYHYQWQSSLSQYSGYTNITDANEKDFIPTEPLWETTYFRRQVTSGVNPPAYSNVVRVTVDPTPFAGEIGYDQVICENSRPAIFLEVQEAKGATLNYQWKSSTTQGGPYTDIFLATNKLYHAPDGLTETTYYIREVNTGVCGILLSNEIAVVVEPTLLAGTITGTQTICEGTSAAPLEGTSAEGGTGDYAYQWKYSLAAGGPYLDVAGANQKDYIVPDYLTQTTFFRRLVSSVGGVCGSVLSNEIRVTVEPALQAGQIGGSDRICEGGDTRAFTSVSPAYGGNLSYNYQWMVSEDPGGPYENISGATAATYKVPDGLTRTSYYVRSVQSGQCATVMSNEIHIKVDSTLFPGVVGHHQTIQVNGDPEPFVQLEKVAGGGDTYSFQWQWSHAIDGPYESIPFATSIEYDVPPGLLQTTYYRRMVTSGVCGSRYTDPIIITVETDLTPGKIGHSGVVCYDNTPPTLIELIDPTGGNGIYSYQWWRATTSKNGPYEIIPGANSRNYAFTSGLTQTTYYTRQVFSGIFPPVFGDTLTIEVLPLLTPGSINAVGPTEICFGDQPAQLAEATRPTGGTNSYQFQWQSSTVSGGPYTDIPNATGPEYLPPSTLDRTTYFIRRVVSGACDAVYTNEIGIIVNPLPVVVLGSSAPGNTICSGDAVLFTVSGALQYEFYLNNLPVQGPSNSTTYSTSSLINADFVHVLGIDVKGCQSLSNQIMTRVYDLPTATITDTASICAGDQINLDLNMTGKMPFEVKYTDGSSEFTLQNLSYNSILNVKPTTPTTYTLISVKDDHGCFQTIHDQKAGVYVEDALALFNASNHSGCSPHIMNFANQDIRPGVTYTWSWGDGTDNDYTTSADPPIISHEFNNYSFYNNSRFQVRLTATTDILGCASTQTQAVTIYPSMEIDVEIDKTIGCAPLQVSFNNRSRGVTSHRWYYRIKGTTENLREINTQFASFVLDNNTERTLIYEIIYEPGAINCQGEPQIFEVTVHPALTAKFRATPDRLQLPNTSFTITNETNRGNWNYFWDFGDNKQVLRARDPESYSYETFGEYEIKLRVEYETCFSEFNQLVVIDPGQPIIDFTTDVIAGCKPLKVNFTNLSVYAELETYHWDFGDNFGTSHREHAEYTFHQAGHYWVTLRGANFLGIPGEKKIRIDVYDIPHADFVVRPHEVFVPDDPIYLTNLSVGADSYHWDFGDGNTSNEFEPVHYYQTEGDYDLLLVATSKEGCVDSLMIKGATGAIEGDRLKIPNVFTPNLSGPTGGRYIRFDYSNDVFMPIAKGVVDFHMRIFNKWGELIFESNDKEIGWDGYYNGRLCPQDVYVYKLYIRFSNGKQIEKIGDVTLLK